MPDGAGRFQNLAAAGAVVAKLPSIDRDPAVPTVVVAILPNGVPVALPVAGALQAPVVAAYIDRDGDLAVHIEGAVHGRRAIVVDDGVETGTAAMAVGQAVRAAGALRVELAVPVCSRQTRALLEPIYDHVHAVVQPMGRRALRWHFADFDTIDELTARRLLAEHAAQP